MGRYPPMRLQSGSPVSRDLMNTYGIRLKWVGRRGMFPPDVTESILKMEAMTARNIA